MYISKKAVMMALLCVPTVVAMESQMDSQEERESNSKELELNLLLQDTANEIGQKLADLLEKKDCIALDQFMDEARELKEYRKSLAESFSDGLVHTVGKMHGKAFMDLWDMILKSYFANLNDLYHCTKAANLDMVVIRQKLLQRLGAARILHGKLQAIGVTVAGMSGITQQHIDQSHAMLVEINNILSV